MQPLPPYFTRVSSEESSWLAQSHPGRPRQKRPRKPQERIWSQKGFEPGSRWGNQQGNLPVLGRSTQEAAPKTMDGSDLRNSRKQRSLWSGVWGALTAAFRAAAVHTNNAAEGRRQKG